MKSKGIVLVLIYLIIVVGFFIPITSRYSRWILLFLFPLILILASIKLSKEGNEYKHKRILIILSSIAVILPPFPYVVGSLGYGQVWNYTDYLLYLSVILMLIASVIVIRNAFIIKSTIKQSLDIIIILLPLTSFLLTEFYLSRSFIHKRRVEQIDLLSVEILKSNVMLANILAIRYSTEFGLYSYDSLQYPHLFESIHNVLYKVLEVSGGYRFNGDELTNKLLEPHNTSNPNYALRNSKVLSDMDTEFEKVKSIENDSLIRKELNEIQNELFGDKVVYNNSVLEMRLRCAIAENRLLTLEIKKRQKFK